jgi:hypothetical protein
MHKALLALGLALSILPVAALADDTSGPPGPPPSPPTQAQRQAIEQTVHTFAQQEDRLHQQTRAQMLASITPAHRAAIANLIGQMAVSTNPQPETLARQIDTLLSQGEQQRILSADASYLQQSKALHEQMRAQVEKDFPAMAQRAGNMHHDTVDRWSDHRANDAGSVLLRTLAPHHDMMIGMHGPGFMMQIHGEGGPPPQP